MTKTRTPRRASYASYTVILIPLFLALGCGGDGGTAPVTISHIEVFPSTFDAIAGETQQFTATVWGSNGTELHDRTITWSSSNTQVVTISSAGLATALDAAGAATIRATSEDVVGTASATISRIPVATITLTPTDAVIAAEESVQLTAVLKDADGNTLTGREVTWVALVDVYGNVSSSGLFTGTKAGVGQIEATSEGVTAEVSVQVTENIAFVFYERGSTTAGTATLTYFGNTVASVLNIGDKTLTDIGVSIDVDDRVTCVFSNAAADGDPDSISDCVGSDAGPYAMRLCINGPGGNDGLLQYVLLPEVDDDRVAATPAELLGALQSETNYLGILVYADCRSSFYPMWVRDYPDVDYFLWPDVFTNYAPSYVEGLLTEAAVMYKTSDAGTDYRKYVVVRSLPSGFEIWH
jgi:hypothetical protein